MNPKYPVFVPTKGRYESPYTIRALQRCNIPFKAVVESQEYSHYVKVVNPDDILVLPHQDKGLVVTRNWIWDYAQSLDAKRYWTFDDNIDDFYRLHKNQRIRCSSGTFLRVMEDFVDRYANVPVAGMHYRFFAPSKQKRPPFLLNTRVYSNMLIETNAKDQNGKAFRNEGFYNDDTDLCLRILKDGQCIITFYVFLIAKHATMQVKGGMTPHYRGDGRYRMALELKRKHPDVVKITRKWGRYQHHVDYRPFKGNRLIRKPDVEIPEGTNNYGMKLVKVAE